MSDFQKMNDTLARRDIIIELSRQPSASLNDEMIENVLFTLGFNRLTTGYIRGQLRQLEEAGAITITEVSDRMIGTLTQRGLDHVRRNIVIDGIAEPRLG